ncbi:MAG: dUTP diphosphatase [Gammaproteobacteria bacterium]|nr:MAG: dUTP diphosphatase [Gammaproteobacteria bacterium]RKZ44626.1 MAG: dUTP diphosphatase [Gammaproteobacteria bacterium]RKZ76114.1 MAG: dUTP diphosphatase [Gammaproteobacteria bacterium]
MHTIEAKIVNPLMGKEIPLPTYSTIGSAGIDLRACIKEPLTIQANETQLIGSGIAINIHNPSMAAVLLPRSGLGVNYGIVLANLVGLIDSDYRKEVKIAVWNRSDKPFTINPGERICQMVFIPITQVNFKWVNELEDNGRDGFGSTGLS